MEKYGHEFGLTGSRAALGFARSTAGPSEGRPAQARCSGEAVWGRSESRGPRDRAGAAAWARRGPGRRPRATRRRRRQFRAPRRRRRHRRQRLGLVRRCPRPGLRTGHLRRRSSPRRPRPRPAGASGYLDVRRRARPRRRIDDVYIDFCAEPNYLQF